MAAVVAIAVIAIVDYLTGVELRVYPLYFAPISLVAWHQGRRAAVLAGLLCTVVWFGANFEAGRHYSLVIAVVNTITQAIAFVLMGVLIAMLIDALARERAISRTDALTGLLNTRAFYAEAEGILSLCRRKARAVTLAYIDLDDFKAVNDTYGHEKGDQVLRRVSTAMHEATRPSDVCARIGGDEFVVLLAEADEAGAAAVLERLRARLVETLSDLHGVVTVSIGAATSPTARHELAAMVREADARMYVAKARGKNQLCLGLAGEHATDGGAPA
ncbi:MAG: diguanylate cyclase [Gemmatimonadetes bacterium]|nr:diguanylate cyclase [Gemmatimonadota bacterium]MBI3567966.1 diguanylate cyclase [Gemmatimonadota bacterium]